MNGRSGNPAGIDPSAYGVEGYEGFRRRALDPKLSPHEKSGFPDVYREGKGNRILADIAGKLPRLGGQEQVILDIGPGCSSLPHALIELCAQQRHRLVLVDSPEMLSQLPDYPHISKVQGMFPDCDYEIRRVASGYDAILVYSVIQYTFAEGNLWQFVDRAAALLNPGGALLLGDIPNVSRRKRFLDSPAGLAYHRENFDPHGRPEVNFSRPEPDMIDDGVVLGSIMRMRLAGYDAFVVPQAPDLPQANRREDILICRP